jgi:hypothetical protein
MGIGATTGDKPDFVDDGDLKTVAELRGAMKDMHKAKLSLNEKATVQGVRTEMEVMRQKMDMLHTQMQRIIGMFQQQESEFKQFREQRIAELGLRMNGGSTTPEDYDNSDRPSDAGN